MSCCDLHLLAVDLESSWHIKRYVIKVCTKFERNREFYFALVAPSGECLRGNGPPDRIVGK